MNITGLGTGHLRLKLRIMSDDDLWWLFLDHREECLQQFWEEVETRKAAGILSNGSPFWTMSNLAPYSQPQHSGSGHSNLIELTREEWETRKRRKMIRVISA